MKGRYFFADYCSGRIWSATESNGAWSITTPLDTNDYSFATFGEDECGELYIASRVNPGYLFRIVAKDSDGDGVPDWYEQLFPGTAAEDHDGDGFTQLQEFLAGTDPENAGSALRITALTENLLTFTSEEGRSYVVEQRSDLSAGQWQPLTNVICAGAGETTVTTSSNLYYRVRLRQ